MTTYVILLTVGILLLIGLIAFLILSPVKTNEKVVAYNTNLDPTTKKLLSMFGGDISAIIGDDWVKKNASKNNLDRLFKLSNNPWKVNYTEFFILQVIFAIIGLFLGAIANGVLLAINTWNWLIAIFMIVLPLFGFMFPITHYQSMANEREKAFKSQLPEAIDYLIMALSGGGYSLPNALEQTVNYLPDNVIKEEFNLILNDNRAGKSMEACLNSFADRAPTDGIKAFAKALNNANKQSVQMVNLLKSRSAESRRTLENEIDKRIATLDARVTMIFSPVAAFSLIAIIMVPTIYQLIQIM